MKDMKDMRHPVRIVFASLLTFLVQCGGDDGTGDEVAECILGELGCGCNQGQCLAGLVCSGGTCVSEASDGSDSTTSTEESTDTSTEVTSDTTSSETGSGCDAPNILCDGECVNPLSDVNHCGECGKTCAVVLDSGGCQQGACQPVWSACMDSSALVLCSDVCQAQGYAGCATTACGEFQMSLLWFATPNNCESGQSLIEVEATACETEPTGMNSDFYRCCCEQN